MATCLQHDTLVAFIERRLSAEEVMSLQEHIDECPLCLEVVACLAAQYEPVATARPNDTPSTPSESGPAPGSIRTEIGTLGVVKRGGPLEPPARMEEYRLVRKIGHGGMGEVYLYEDTILGRLVAVKFISASLRGGSARERFLTEAQAVARLSHPNVLTLYRVSEYQGQPFLVSEYLHGKSLAELERPIDPAEVLRIGIELARGLAAAHRRGVLHRDIKPSNVIRTEQNGVKLLDFGLAKLLEEESPRAASLSAGLGTPDPGPTPAALTHASTLVGTPLYMAPEIWRGEPATKRADVYSLGAVLYELCAGRPPHSGKTLAELSQRVQTRAAAPLLSLLPSIDERLAATVDRCLERDAEQRFADSDALCRALEGLSHGLGILPVGNPYRGLAAFEAMHRPLFFGRGTETRELTTLLSAEPLVVLVGDSGSGKSSLCRAGVLPLVADGAFADGRQWRVATLVPGRMPLSSLSQALAPYLGESAEELDAGLRCQPASLLPALRRKLGERYGVVVFIDQMEELTTQSDPEEAKQFCAALRHLFTRSYFVRVLVTVRSDFLTRVVETLGLTGAVTRSLYLLHSLSEESLRDAIVGPAVAKDVRFESTSTIDALVHSTIQSAGGLPLLQFALTELWTVRDQQQRVIQADALAAIGGVSGALARHADGVLTRLSTAQHAAARRILNKLVSPQGTRIRRFSSELITDDANERTALEALVSGRLVLVREGESGQATLEIAHEALIQGWATLRSWLAEDVDSRAAQQRLSAAAQDWQRLGKHRDALWSERQLNEAALARLKTQALTPDEAEFLRSSRHYAWRRKYLWVSFTASVLILLAGVCLPYLQDEQSYRAHLKNAKYYYDHARKKGDEAIVNRLHSYALYDNFNRAGGEVRWRLALNNEEEALAANAQAEQELSDAKRKTFFSNRQALVILSRDVAAQRAQIADRRHGIPPVTMPASARTQSPPTRVNPKFAWVPPGISLYGSAEPERERHWLKAQPQHEVYTDGYLIGKQEVTLEEYIEFLNDLSVDEREKRRPQARTAQGEVDLTQDARGVWWLSIKPHSCCRYVVPFGAPIIYAGRTLRARQDWRRLPVSGISIDDARAYASWYSRKYLPGARLCSEHEWERAARGNTGRLFPNGNTLRPDQANYEETYNMNSGALGPDEVHSHRASDSQFEVADMAGNVWEWVDSVESRAESVLRGGSYDQDYRTVQSTNREISKVWLLDARSINLGMRLCASVHQGPPR